MTTSISAVNSGSMAAAGNAIQQTSLSDETKSKLQALGIEVTEGMTESEAQTQIAQAQQNQQNTGSQQNETESEFLSEAATLASYIGVSVSNTASVSDILDDIAAELEELLEEAQNNPGLLPQLSSYLSELTDLDNRYDSSQASRSSVYEALNVISNNNKFAHGLE